METVGFIAGGITVVFIGVVIYSIMRISSKCSREEESGDYGTVGWAMDKWGKYRCPTVLDNGEFQE